MSILDLPPEILHAIFANLAVLEVIPVSGVCRAWRALASDASLWKGFEADVTRALNCAGADVVRFSELSFESGEKIRSFINALPILCAHVLRGVEEVYLSNYAWNDTNATLELLHMLGDAPVLQRIRTHSHDLNQMLSFAGTRLKSIAVRVLDCSLLEVVVKWQHLTEVSGSVEPEAVRGLDAGVTLPFESLSLEATGNDAEYVGRLVRACPRLQKLSLYMNDDGSPQGVFGDPQAATVPHHLQSFICMNFRKAQLNDLHAYTWPRLQKLSCFVHHDTFYLEDIVNVLELATLRAPQLNEIALFGITLSLPAGWRGAATGEASVGGGSGVPGESVLARCMSSLRRRTRLNQLVLMLDTTIRTERIPFLDLLSDLSETVLATTSGEIPTPVAPGGDWRTFWREPLAALGFNDTDALKGQHAHVSPSYWARWGGWRVKIWFTTEYTPLPYDAWRATMEGGAGVDSKIRLTWSMERCTWPRELP